MSDQTTPEEWIGPMTTVETMLLRSESGAKDDEMIKFLKETIANLERSLVLKKRELAEFRAKKTKILREIAKSRGKDTGALPIRAVDRPGDGSLWIVVGGCPVEA